VYVYTNGTFHIVTGIIYGIDGGDKMNTDERGDGYALLLNNGATAEYGTFNGDIWNATSGGTLSSTNNTIKVEKGVRIQ
jgi:hypothetical protein